MNKNYFIKKLESVKHIKFRKAEDFLEAAKICREYYGEKCLYPYESIDAKHCAVSINSDKSGHFSLSIKKEMDYRKDKNISEIDFLTIYLGKQVVIHRLLEIELVKVYNELLQKCGELYQSCRLTENIKNKKTKIKEIKSLIEKITI